MALLTDEIRFTGLDRVGHPVLLRWRPTRMKGDLGSSISLLLTYWLDLVCFETPLRLALQLGLRVGGLERVALSLPTPCCGLAPLPAAGTGLTCPCGAQVRGEVELVKLEAGSHSTNMLEGLLSEAGLRTLEAQFLAAVLASELLHAVTASRAAMRPLHEEAAFFGYRDCLRSRSRSQSSPDEIALRSWAAELGPLLKKELGILS